MDKKEFSQIREHLGKTQKQLAQLLGTSAKAIQSFEQGWRNTPVHTERQVLFLMALKYAQEKMTRPCWVIKGCPEEIRQNTRHGLRPAVEGTTQAYMKGTIKYTLP